MSRFGQAGARAEMRFERGSGGWLEVERACVRACAEMVRMVEGVVKGASSVFRGEGG